MISRRTSSLHRFFYFMLINLETDDNASLLKLQRPLLYPLKTATPNTMKRPQKSDHNNGCSETLQQVLEHFFSEAI